MEVQADQHSADSDTRNGTGILSRLAALIRERPVHSGTMNIFGDNSCQLVRPTAGGGAGGEVWQLQLLSAKFGPRCRIIGLAGPSKLQRHCQMTSPLELFTFPVSS